jgi:hypothetical protein
MEQTPLNHLSFVCITALADDTRRVELHKVDGLGHVLGMLIAYFLKEKIVVVIPLASGATSMITKNRLIPILDFRFPSDYCGRRNKPQ